MLYYDYVYEFDYLTIAVPFMFSIVLFYVTYWAFFKSYPHRIRQKKLVSRYVLVFSHTRGAMQGDSMSNS